MEDNRYPDLEMDQDANQCSEPPVGYTAVNSGYTNTIAPKDDEKVVVDNWDPGIGPYSMEELNARIDEAEVFIEKAENGDWSDWITEEQSRANLYKKYPWLQLSGH